MYNYEDLIGVPFADGGRTIAEGLDCYGLASLIYARAGLELPDYQICAQDAVHIDGAIAAGRQHWQRLTISELDTAPCPCLVVMRFNQVELCNHVGVYVGQGRFVHTREKIGVNVDRLDSPAWKKKIEGFYIPKLGTVKHAKQTNNHS